MIRTIELIGLLSSATLVIGAEKDVLDNWRKVVSTNDFAKVASLQDATLFRTFFYRAIHPYGMCQCQVKAL